MYKLLKLSLILNGAGPPLKWFVLGPMVAVRFKTCTSPPALNITSITFLLNLAFRLTAFAMEPRNASAWMSTNIMWTATSVGIVSASSVVCTCLQALITNLRGGSVVYQCHFLRLLLTTMQFLCLSLSSKYLSYLIPQNQQKHHAKTFISSNALY